MSLDQAYNASNVLAMIARGEAPSTKIYEDADTMAIMDIFPQSEGHALVFHKRAAAVNILDIDAQALSAVALTLQKVARAATRALKPDGVRIAQFNGAPAGQSIFHLHFHVIPTYADRPLMPHAGTRADAATLDALAAKYRAAF